jgi:hypothetical protein
MGSALAVETSPLTAPSATLVAVSATERAMAKAEATICSLDPVSIAPAIRAGRLLEAKPKRWRLLMMRCPCKS